jgi:hydroxypyruvate reductase
MAAAAVEHLTRRRYEPAGGIIVAPEASYPPHPSLESIVGDHPLPGGRALAAASRRGDLARRVASDDEVWVLLSGGATSLVAAPDRDIRPDDLRELYSLLLGSGLDIVAMNVARKRFSRWGAGRLALALGAARVRTLIISDVIGDDPAIVGSGPCVPDPSTAADVRSILTGSGLWPRLPAGLRSLLAAVERDPSLETPKAGHEAFRRVQTRVIAGNRTALEAAVSRAAELGLDAHLASATVVGEAADVGARLVALLLHYDDARTGREGETIGRSCLVWGGETTVTLGDRHGRGGRCQELSLAAARALAAHRAPRGVSLLAAGTDGRDGDTDAAGAMVDATTWDAIARAGIDPERALAAHDSYAALDAAGALLRTGLTGTNVMDLMIGLGARAAAQAEEAA